MNKQHLQELEIIAAMLRGERVVVAYPSEKQAREMMERYRCEATWPGKKLSGLPPHRKD